MNVVRFVATVAVTLSLVASAAGVVAAASPYREHSSGRWTEPDEICGLPVIADRRRVDTFWVRTMHDGFEVIATTFSGTTRWTYGPTGRWVENHFSGQFRDVDIRVNDDGTVSFTFGWIGAQILFRSSDHDVDFRDVGRYIVRDTWSFGDPDDGDDDVLVSSEVLQASGQRLSPDADLCAAILPALLG